MKAAKAAKGIAVWIAQCLEHDIGAQANDLKSLARRITAAINAELQESMERTGEPFGGIAPAPKFFHERWKAQSGHFTPAPDGTTSDNLKLEMALSA